jgi:hypothetical protein
MRLRRILIALFIVSTLIAAATPRAVGQTAVPRAKERSRPLVAVGPQYDATHVYVPSADVDTFVAAFLGTLGGTSTKQAVVTVTPTPSSTTSQVLQTPVGTVSLFGFRTPIPYPFGSERYGYLVTDMSTALKAARLAGASVIVPQFPDAIGIDAVIQWPGGVNMQLYWHTKAPAYAGLQRIPESRVYVSPDRVEAFVKSFVDFSQGKVVLDDPRTSGTEIGMPHDTIRRIRIESTFGNMAVFSTNGFLPFPYGIETTGYEVDSLDATLKRAATFGVTVLVPPYEVDQRRAAMVEFPGGYIAEIHETLSPANTAH